MKHSNQFPAANQHECRIAAEVPLMPLGECALPITPGDILLPEEAHLSTSNNQDHLVLIANDQATAAFRNPPRSSCPILNLGDPQNTPVSLIRSPNSAADHRVTNGRAAFSSSFISYLPTLYSDNEEEVAENFDMDNLDHTPPPEEIINKYWQTLQGVVREPYTRGLCSYSYITASTLACLNAHLLVATACLNPQILILSLMQPFCPTCYLSLALNTLAPMSILILGAGLSLTIIYGSYQAYKIYQDPDNYNPPELPKEIDDYPTPAHKASSSLIYGAWYGSLSALTSTASLTYIFLIPKTIYLQYLVALAVGSAALSVASLAFGAMWALSLYFSTPAIDPHAPLPANLAHLL